MVRAVQVSPATPAAGTTRPTGFAVPSLGAGSGDPGPALAVGRGEAARCAASGPGRSA
ncbi:hypothetical protein ACFQ0M_22320 [Kitasatospora aburaviensis]